MQFNSQFGVLVLMSGHDYHSGHDRDLQTRASRIHGTLRCDNWKHLDVLARKGAVDLLFSEGRVLHTVRSLQSPISLPQITRFSFNSIFHQLNVSVVVGWKQRKSRQNP